MPGIIRILRAIFCIRFNKTVLIFSLKLLISINALVLGTMTNLVCGYMYLKSDGILFESQGGQVHVMNKSYGRLAGGEFCVYTDQREIGNILIFPMIGNETMEMGYTGT